MPRWMVTDDVFAEFNRECGAIDVTELRRRLEVGDIAVDDCFLAGQGLTEASCAEIEAAAHHLGHAGAFSYWRHGSDARRAPRSLTHKHQPQNSMISVPQKCMDGSYRSDLLISSGNELISDHVTGQHVQGMVLVEACRQMFIAVSEMCHMDHQNGRLGYVVFNRMEASFMAFTFPIPARVEYREVSRGEPRPDRLAISAELTVIQNDRATTKLNVDYTLFASDRLKQKEISLGIDAVNSYSDSVAGQILAAAE